MLTEALKARFDKEVRDHDLVVYMKGSPDFPRCGFSARVVDLLSPYGELYAVDVLAEPDVREAIKEYSSWPTLPQVFIRGQFVGGCDIVAELAEKGELAALCAPPR
jgi:monothiol glutaredoxin